MILREAVRIPALIAACQPLLVAEERLFRRQGCGISIYNPLSAVRRGNNT